MKRLFYVLSATILWACAAAALPARKAALDPSDPDAPESKPLPISTALAPERALADEADQGRNHEGHQHGAVQDGAQGSPDPGVADYTCPMHPEISQPGPGQCPKCGMALVPREQKAEPKSSGEPNPPQHEHHREHGGPR